MTERQAARLGPLGLLGDDPPSLVDAWRRVEDMWGVTIEDALTRPAADLDARVNGEWSFLETLRHLIFVTDAWIGHVVRELPSPYDPIGMPPHFVTDGAELGLDLDARPPVEDVLAARRRRTALVRDTLATITTTELDRTCTPRGRQFTVLGAMQIVIFEEWAHHQYARRDLGLHDAPRPR